MLIKSLILKDILTWILQSTDASELEKRDEVLSEETDDLDDVERAKKGRKRKGRKGKKGKKRKGKALTVDDEVREITS
jgi:hypothetical protein